MNENRIELQSMINTNQCIINANISAIHDEMKDFHGRLCAIEERNKSK